MHELNARDDLRAARLRIAAREGVPAIAVLSWETPGGEPPAMPSAAVDDGRAVDQVLAAAWEELAADQREDDLASVAALMLTAAVRDASPIIDAPAPVGLPHPPDDAPSGESSPGESSPGGSPSGTSSPGAQP